VSSSQVLGLQMCTFCTFAGIHTSIYTPTVCSAHVQISTSACMWPHSHAFTLIHVNS
jgi:hypothetical protein